MCCITRRSPTCVSITSDYHTLHGTARHGTALHGSARHPITGHGMAWQGRALLHTQHRLRARKRLKQRTTHFHIHCSIFGSKDGRTRPPSILGGGRQKIPLPARRLGACEHRASAARAQCRVFGKKGSLHNHLAEAISETTDVLELRQGLLYTTPSG